MLEHLYIYSSKHDNFEVVKIIVCKEACSLNFMLNKINEKYLINHISHLRGCLNYVCEF